MSDNGILDFVSNYYSEKIREHGATPQGVDWNGVVSQNIRFQQLLRVCDREQNFQINDYGCGYGALLKYLLDNEISCFYRGYDIAQTMIDEAAKLFGKDERWQFCHGADYTESADYTVASGIFNVRGQLDDPKWLEYINDVLEKIDRLSKRGFSFNMLTKYSDADRMRDYLYYADPCYFFDLCKRSFSKQVALLHDYGLYEFTIIVRKDV